MPYIRVRPYMHEEHTGWVAGAFSRLPTIQVHCVVVRLGESSQGKRVLFRFVLLYFYSLLLLGSLSPVVAAVGVVIAHLFSFSLWGYGVVARYQQAASGRIGAAGRSWVEGGGVLGVAS